MNSVIDCFFGPLHNSDQNVQDSSNFSFILGNGSLEDSKKLIKKGLTRSKKTIPFYFLYDQKGSEFFEEITTLEEYYLTNCELNILKENADKIAEGYLVNGEKSVCPIIVELGSGSSMKTKVLLESFLKLFSQVHYIPIEISASILKETGNKLKQYSNLKITCFCGTYEEGLQFIVSNFGTVPKLILFLGSSIGNFSRNEAADFLRNISAVMIPQDQLLIGIDLRKEPSVVFNAYNDSKGITAKFILNILLRMNEEMGADFNLEDFEFAPEYFVSEGRIEIGLRSKRAQTVTIKQLNLVVAFQKGEILHVEESNKYSFLEIDTLAFFSKFQLNRIWLDKSKKFSLSSFSCLDTTYSNLGSSYLASLNSFSDLSSPTKMYSNILQEAWKFSDKIFDLLQSDAFFEKPIHLRHPFIFYFGHLPAFANNQICNPFTQSPSINPYFDSIFERGIDPNVEDPMQCHPHSQVPTNWPSLKEIFDYKQQVREKVIQQISALFTLLSSSVKHLNLSEEKKVLISKGRVFLMVAEHDYMVFSFFKPLK